MYEKATLHGRVGIKPPVNVVPKRVLTPEQKRRKAFLRKCRLERLNELIRQHAGDSDYFHSVSRWRHEKLDLIEFT
jgi:hypothetical protein